MTEWTNEQLVFITTAYFSEGKSLKQAQRSFKKQFKMKSSPSKKIIQRCIRNFTSFGNLNKNKPTGRPVTVTTQTNIDMATQIIGDNNSVSLRHLSQQMGISYSSTQTLVKKKLKFRPYKVQVCQQLQPGDFARRTQFCEWFLQKLDDQHFIGGLIFSDEAHFSLSGYVNRQNLRFWAGNNPMEIIENPLHSERVAV